MTSFTEMADEPAPRKGGPPIHLPDGFDPGASVQADVEQAGEFSLLLRRHGVSQQDQLRPASPWDANGRLLISGAPPAAPGTAPSNGGLAASLSR
jgi:hypothetical protein